MAAPVGPKKVNRYTITVETIPRYGYPAISVLA